MTSRTLVAMSVGVAICTLGTGALNALEVFFIRDNLHAPASWLGAFSALTITAAGLSIIRPLSSVAAPSRDC